jgi:hypothetical protein
MPSSPTPGYRGPRRALLGGLFAIALGGAATVATFVMLQEKGAGGIVGDIAGPVINAVLDALGQDRIDALSTSADSSSTLLIAAFVLSAAVTGLGAFLLIIGSLWTLARGTRQTHSVAAPLLTRLAHNSGARMRRFRGHDGAQLQLAAPPVSTHIANADLTTGDPLEQLGSDG